MSRRRAAELAADRAVAVGQGAHRIDLETNAAAGAAPFDHLIVFPYSSLPAFYG